MTRHDRCLVDTFLLEVDLYGEPMSPSVAERVRRIDESMRIEALIRFGGTRALERAEITRSAE